MISYLPKKKIYRWLDSTFYEPCVHVQVQLLRDWKKKILITKYMILHDPAMNASKLTKSPVLEVVERKLHPDKQTTSFQSP